MEMKRVGILQMLGLLLFSLALLIGCGDESDPGFDYCDCPTVKTMNPSPGKFPKCLEADRVDDGAYEDCRICWFDNHKPGAYIERQLCGSVAVMFCRDGSVSAWNHVGYTVEQNCE